jgi:hypothetical protein
VRRHGNRLRARRTKPVHRSRRGGNRQTGQHGGDAGDILSLRSVQLSAAKDHVFHLARVELRRLAQHGLNAKRAQIVGPREIERPAKRFRQARSRACDNDRFPHDDRRANQYTSG